MGEVFLGGRCQGPGWERLWDDFVQEELRIHSGSTSQREEDDEEIVALSTMGKKKKSRKVPLYNVRKLIGSLCWTMSQQKGELGSSLNKGM